MRILSLAVIGMYLSILNAFSQSPADSSQFRNRKLQVEEVNFISAYYKQDGNNSAVTAGIGSEKLTDFTNSIELKLFKYDNKKRKNKFSIDFGIDHYSSASSDNIDPKTISSASMDDTRFYPSVSWNRENENQGTNIGFNASYSKEADYISYGTGINFSKTSSDQNRELDIKLQAFFDKWKVIYPAELRPTNYGTGAKGDTLQVDIAPRNSFSASVTFSQVINQKLQVLFLFDPAFQQGLLGTKFHRVFLSDGSTRSENLPNHKMKFPIGVRSNYFFGDHIIFRSLYRFYIDSWGMKAHTVELETPIKFSSIVSLTPFYRFHKQSAIDYFAPFGENKPDQVYYTSDYDLSTLKSHFFGVGLRASPAKGIFGASNWNMLEVRYGHYTRTTGLQSDVISLHLTFK